MGRPHQHVLQPQLHGVAHGGALGDPLQVFPHPRHGPPAGSSGVVVATKPDRLAPSSKWLHAQVQPDCIPAKAKTYETLLVPGEEAITGSLSLACVQSQG